MSEEPPSQTPVIDPNQEWEQVAREMSGWDSDLQVHARRLLDARGIGYVAEEGTEIEAPRLQNADNASVNEVLTQLADTQVDPALPRPKQELISDSPYIEDQRYSFIKSEGSTNLVFKLTPQGYEQLDNRRSVLPEPTSGNIHYSYTEDDPYYGHGVSTKEITAAEVDIFSVDGFEVTIARQNSEWRSLEGLVDITLPTQETEGTPISTEVLSQRLDNLMSEMFGIEGAFKPSVVDVDELPRSEVLPGYSAVVEPGKSEEYEQVHGEIAFTHRIDDAADLPAIFQSGLLSTHERLLRGVGNLGQTSEADLKSGGAESVFVRAITGRSLRSDDNERPFEDYETVLILKPELADRTDWYALEGDKFGGTDASTTDKRLTPDELFTMMDNEGAFYGNEEMFHTGIGSEAIAGVAVGSEEYRQTALNTLRAAGITGVNGTRVEDFVHVVNRMTQILDIAHGRLPTIVQLTDARTEVQKQSNNPEIASKIDRFPDLPDTI